MTTHKEPHENQPADSPASASSLEIARDHLVSAEVWRPLLEKYAAATSLAVALADPRGHLAGECINPQPLWKLLRDRVPANEGDCPFCLHPVRVEDCARRAIEGTSRTLAAGYAGLVHFTVPLRVDGEVIGMLMAGQVSNRFPEQLQIQQTAKDFNISSVVLLQIARSQIPVSDKVLLVYWDLLEMFADSFLKTHLHRFVEEQRLAEMTKMGELLMKRTEELTQLDRRKDEFLATLSHELRTPLTAIVGWIRLLRSGRTDERTLPTALEVIERNAVIQAQLVDDLLEVSRFITGKVQLNIEPTDLVTVINAAVDSVRPSAEIKNIPIQVVLDTSARSVMGDPSRLQQILWNLLTNAVKFTPQNGRIEVRLERVDSSARIVVSDTGEGIRTEFLSSMFDRFTQADSSRTRHHGGLGIGLAIVRQLVELHGGSVAAQSAGERQGATIHVTLPLANAEAAHLEEEAEWVESRPNLQGLRILVVEHEPVTRDLLTEVLGTANARITVTESLQDALQIFDREPADVVIADLALPDGDAFKIIENLRSRTSEDGANTLAIALTASPGDWDWQRALAAGFHAQITTPSIPDRLSALIAELTAVRHKRAS